MAWFNMMVSTQPLNTLALFTNLLKNEEQFFYDQSDQKVSGVTIVREHIEIIRRQYYSFFSVDSI